MNSEVDYLGMLAKINDNLSSFKDDMRNEIHEVNLAIVGIRADIKNINDKLEPRIERLEATQSLHDHNVMLMKEDIKNAQMALIKVEDLPAEVKTIKHRIGNNEQHIAILEEINNIEDHEKFSERLTAAEKNITLLNERTKHVETNKQIIDGQKAVWKFLQNKNVWTIVLFIITTAAATYGIKVTT